MKVCGVGGWGGVLVGVWAGVGMTGRQADVSDQVAERCVQSTSVKATAGGHW